jgi:hypothetical protein
MQFYAAKLIKNQVGKLFYDTIEFYILKSNCFNSVCQKYDPIFLTSGLLKRAIVQ